MGVEDIAKGLPPLIKAIQNSGRQVLWTCDPMHGNTKTTNDGIKTRYFSDILSELKQAFAIHADCGSVLGGVHLELTGDNVTECLGGARDLKEQDLSRAYKSLVDPRLNYEQALEVAMLVSQELKG
jgi:3-deoxy-7-phosphoheptulonate synthase